MHPSETVVNRPDRSGSKNRNWKVVTRATAALMVIAAASGCMFTAPPIVAVPQVAAGYEHSMAVTLDGTLYAWGRNANGELGIGPPTTDVNTPTAVSMAETFPSPIRSISLGEWYSLALLRNGQVYGWGKNNLGEVGDGTTGTDRHFPVPVSVSDNVRFKAVSAGFAISLAITTNDRLYSWGAADLNPGGSLAQVQPEPVSGTGSMAFKAVAAGGFHALALSTDGQVFAWGANSHGQLGGGNTTPSDTPIPISVSDATRFKAIAADELHSLALTVDGRVYAWGDNRRGQVGDGACCSDRLLPVPISVSDTVRFAAIAAGEYFSIALSEDGVIYAWGQNSLGQLGDGTSGTDRELPAPVSVDDDVRFVAITAGGYHALAVTTDGRVYAWGDNDFKQLGDPALTIREQPTPTDINLALW